MTNQNQGGKKGGQHQQDQGKRTGQQGGQSTNKDMPRNPQQR